MTTEQEKQIRETIDSFFVSGNRNDEGFYCSVGSPEEIMNFFKDMILPLEKQAAIDALAKAEKVKEISDELNHLSVEAHIEEFDRQTQLGARCGTLAAYLANFIDQMTPDQREIVAIQFDQNLFGTDEAMAKRFRDANNKDTINN